MQRKDLGSNLPGASREFAGVIGIALIALGAFLIYLPAGCIVLGLEFCGIAFLYALTDEAAQ